MSTEWTQPGTEQRWQQPSFDGPTLSGEVLLPGEKRPQVPALSEEERRLRMFRRWLLPLALVAAVITGAWWQMFVVAVIISVVLRRRIWQLTAQRLAARSGPWQTSAGDLR